MTTLAEHLRALRRLVLLRGLDWLGERRRRILAWQAMAAAGVQTVTFARDGLTWQVPAGDPYIGFGLFVEGGFAQGHIEALLAWLRAHGRSLGRGDVVVDVGANIGSTCIPIVRAHGCRAVAIEPVPAVFALLAENVTGNGLSDRVVLVQAAVAEKPGRVTMALGGNLGAATVLPASPERSEAIGGSDRFDVVALPLENVLATAGIKPSDVTLVWADVQGSEAAVIETGGALWSSGVPLWAEFEPGALASHGGTDRFYAACHAHFASFIEASRLVSEGPAAMPQGISDLREVLSRTRLQTDVLLLPWAFAERGGR